MALFGRVRNDPLFLGLTRPAVIFGVSFVYFAFNMIGCLMYFIITSDFKVVLVGAAIHIVGMAVTKKEPLAMEILLVRVQKCNKCVNKQFFGGRNSYDVF